MNKKLYNQPSMKVIELKSTDIICGSLDEPTPMSLNDEVDNYDNHEHVVETSDVWGAQW